MGWAARRRFGQRRDDRAADAPRSIDRRHRVHEVGDRSAAADAARAVGRDETPLGHPAGGAFCGRAREPDVQDVGTGRLVTVGAVPDGADVLGAANEAFGEKESGGELAVGARRTHDHHEGRRAQADFKRLLGGGAIVRAGVGPATDTNHADQPAGVGGHNMSVASG